MEDEFNKRFLTETDKSGRHIVKSFRTGHVYYVEPIETERTPKWGDVNVVTKKTEGNYGEKYPGGVREEESLITPENGFTTITYSGTGASPYSVIDELDAKYPSL